MDPGGEDRELLEIGRRSASAPRRGWFLLGAAAVVAVALVVAGVTVGKTSDQEVPDRSEALRADSTPVGPPVEVSELGRQLVGEHAGWELIAYARATGRHYRAELSSGRVSRTMVPPLQSSGPLSMLVLADRTLIRPLDHVPGYVVVDGQRARRERLSGGGVVLPGPREGTLWVQRGTRTAGLLALVGADDGQPTGQELVLPASTGWPMPDGRGHALVETVDAWYVVDATGAHRVTAGDVLAVGPSAFLLLECDERGGCSRVVLDRDDRTRRRLGPVERPVDRPGSPGVVAPDGSVAAMRAPAADDRSLRLVDLRTGEVIDVYLPSRIASGSSALAWSPDGRWLLVAADRVLTVRPRDDAAPLVGNLGPELSEVTSVAVRPAPVPDSGPPRTWRSGGDCEVSGTSTRP